MSLVTPKKILAQHSNGQEHTFWYFASLPTHAQAQKYSPNIVRMQEGVRQLVEKRVITAVIDAEYLQHNDYLHHRGSGIDTALAKSLAQHSVVLLIDWESYVPQEPTKQAILYGRIMQNLRLARKFGITAGVLIPNTQAKDASDVPQFQIVQANGYF